jgi:putative chitinase
MITAADLSRFAPNARPEYAAALLGGLDHLRSAGILETPLRLCHFMAQAAHETGGFTIVRENLNYATAKRLRTVWPVRFGDKSDADLAPLVKNPVALGDAVYTGRMGNDTTGDGYAYRGGGFLQTTGKSAVADYARALGLSPSAALLDDLSVTLRFACLEWAESDCCEAADANDIVAVSKAINTGSATSGVKPVGMTDRQAWFAKAWAIWGEKGKADVPAGKPMTVAETAIKVAAPVVAAAEVARQAAPVVAPVPQALTDTLLNLSSWQAFGTSTQVLLTKQMLPPLAVAALVYWLVVKFIPWWRS